MKAEHFLDVKTTGCHGCIGNAHSVFEHAFQENNAVDDGVIFSRRIGIEWNRCFSAYPSEWRIQQYRPPKHRKFFWRLNPKAFLYNAYAIAGISRIMCWMKWNAYEMNASRNQRGLTKIRLTNNLTWCDTEHWFCQWKPMMNRSTHAFFLFFPEKRTFFRNVQYLILDLKTLQSVLQPRIGLNKANRFLSWRARITGWRKWESLFDLQTNLWFRRYLTSSSFWEFCVFGTPAGDQ